MILSSLAKEAYKLGYNATLDNQYALLDEVRRLRQDRDKWKAEAERMYAANMQKSKRNIKQKS